MEKYGVIMEADADIGQYIGLSGTIVLITYPPMGHFTDNGVARVRLFHGLKLNARAGDSTFVLVGIYGPNL